MAFVLGISDGFEITNIKENLEDIAEVWADYILYSKEKPEILIARSASMDYKAWDIKDSNYPMTNIDLARALVTLVAEQVLIKEPDFDLATVPVKSWGTTVYDTHDGKKTTLKDFQNILGLHETPKIPCDEGTFHSTWLKESTFPLVITDKYYRVEPEFVENFNNMEPKFKEFHPNLSHGLTPNIVAICDMREQQQHFRRAIKIANVAKSFATINRKYI